MGGLLLLQKAWGFWCGARRRLMLRKGEEKSSRSPYVFKHPTYLAGVQHPREQTQNDVRWRMLFIVYIVLRGEFLIFFSLAKCTWKDYTLRDIDNMHKTLESSHTPSLDPDKSTWEVALHFEVFQQILFARNSTFLEAKPLLFLAEETGTMISIGFSAM